MRDGGDLAGSAGSGTGNRVENRRGQSSLCFASGRQAGVSLCDEELGGARTGGGDSCSAIGGERTHGGGQQQHGGSATGAGICHLAVESRGERCSRAAER